MATTPARRGDRAAIYLYQDERGICVYEQWRGQPVQKRLIRFEGGRGAKWGSKSNDGRRFAVIDLQTDESGSGFDADADAPLKRAIWVVVSRFTRP